MQRPPKKLTQMGLREKGHGVKVGPGHQDPGPPQSLKVGPGIPLKFNSGTPGPLL